MFLDISNPIIKNIQKKYNFFFNRKNNLDNYNYIYINNKSWYVPKNLTIIQACEFLGIKIPRFCYHKNLAVAGNCRVCLVEVLNSPKPVVACSVPVINGMQIYTKTPLVLKARENILEFLLLNHPLDCPICDQGGECDLQEYSLLYGADFGRFYNFKRSVQNKNCGPLIKTIMTRCIHCTRCIRFLTNVAGTPLFGTTNRGTRTEVTTFLAKSINSEISGNIIDLCPVGALTSKPYAFVGRPWELKSVDTIDIFDALGANIRVDVCRSQIVRILPRVNDNLNGDWISDKTRFSYDGYSIQKLTAILIRVNGFLQEEDLNENSLVLLLLINTLFYLNKFSLKLKLKLFENNIWLNQFLYYWLFDLTNKIYWYDININYLNKKALTSLNLHKLIGGIYGKNSSVENIISIKNFINILGSNKIFNTTNIIQTKSDVLVNNQFNTQFKNFKNTKLVILVSVNLLNENPILNARLRNYYLKNNLTIGNIGLTKKLTFPTNNFGNNLEILNQIFNGTFIANLNLVHQKQTTFINGMTLFNRLDTNNIFYKLNYISSRLHFYINVNNFLHPCPLHLNGIEVNAILPNSIHYNNQVSKIFKKLKILYLLNSDNIKIKFLKNKFIVYFGHHYDLNSSYSNIIIPVPDIIESNDIFINNEGRIQKLTQILSNSNIFNFLEKWGQKITLTQFFGIKNLYFKKGHIT
jgi:NADH dehydrogenase/NADH:ubiquinone oxidoreductase subunit G